VTGLSQAFVTYEVDKIVFVLHSNHYYLNRN